MTFRNISVRLDANVGGFKAGMGQASKAVKDFDADVTKSSDSLGKAKRSTEELARGATIAGGVMVAGFALAVKASMEFDKQMSNVGAVTSATADEMGALRTAAIEAGKATVFSAGESAQAIAELAKAGVSTADILSGALRGALDLAAAGNIDLASAAEIAAQAINIFKLRGRDVGHVADLLAAGANKSAAGVGDLGDALRQGGLVAAQTGASIEETVGALSAFADSALVGSDAGTSFKTMLQRLTPQSKEAAALMEEIGFSAYDARGNFIGLAGVADELQTSMKDMTAEQRSLTMATLFGSDAVRGASVLYQLGARGVREYTEAVNDQGAAQRMAAAQLDNLAGDVEAFKGSLETAFITTGSQANGVLREMVQTATDVVNGFADLPPSVQAVTMGVSGLGGATLLTAGAVGSFLPKLREAHAALQAMGPAGVAASRGLSLIGPAALGVVAALSIYGVASQNAQRRTEELIASLNKGIDTTSADSLAGGLEAVNRELEKAMALESRLDRGEGAWGNFLDMTEMAGELVNPWSANDLFEAKGAARDLLKERERLAGQLVHMEENLIGVSKATGLTTAQVERLAQKTGVDLAGGFQKTVGALTAAHAEMVAGSAASQELTAGLDAMGDEAVDAEERLEGFSKALDAIFGMAFDVEEALDGLDEALEDLSETARRNAEEVSNAADKQAAMAEAGRSNREAARSAVEAVLRLVEAEMKHGASAERLNTILATQKQRLIETFTAVGITRQEAERYASVLNNVPTNVVTKVAVDGVQSSIDEIERLQNSLRTIGGTTRVVLSPTAHVEADGGIVRFRQFAAGGVARENHVAQIAKAGDWRVWAEPETGGEAYIPLAKSKESRSTAVLGDVADHFGYRLVPYADGGYIGQRHPVGGMEIDYDRLAAAVARNGGSRAPVQISQTFNERVDAMHVAAELAWRLP